MKQIFVDLETTGLDPKTDVITEVGMIYKKNGKIVKTFNHIGRKGMSKAILNFLDSIIDKYDSSDKAYFLAYNARFDADFMYAFFRECPGSNFGNYFYHTPVDILQIAAYKFMRTRKVPENFKLATVARSLGIKISEGNLHTAMYNIKLTNEVYKKLLKL